MFHDDPWVLRDLQPALPKSFHFLSVKVFLALLRGDAKCQGNKITGSVLCYSIVMGGGPGCLGQEAHSPRRSKACAML